MYPYGVVAGEATFEAGLGARTGDRDGDGVREREGETYFFFFEEDGVPGTFFGVESEFDFLIEADFLRDPDGVLVVAAFNREEERSG